MQFATRYFVRCFDKFRSFSKTHQVLCAYMNKSDNTTEWLIHCIGCIAHVFGMYLIRVGSVKYLLYHPMKTPSCVYVMFTKYLSFPEKATRNIFRALTKVTRILSFSLAFCEYASLISSPEYVLKAIESHNCFVS